MEIATTQWLRKTFYGCTLQSRKISSNNKLLKVFGYTWFITRLFIIIVKDKDCQLYGCALLSTGDSKRTNTSK